jgi:hypothetical protein
MLILGDEIICPAEIFRFVERDQSIYDRQVQILMNGMMSYGYMVLHFLWDVNFLKEEFQGKDKFLQIHLTQS